MHMITYRSSSWILALIVLGAFSMGLWTCKYPEGPVHGNTPPRTRLANLPADDPIAIYIKKNAFPEIELYWLGDDPDGYVVAFQYQWRRAGANRQFPDLKEEDWVTLLNLPKVGQRQNIILVKGHPPSIFNIYNFLATLGQGDTALANRIYDSLATTRTFAVPYKSGIVPTDSIAGSPILVLQTPTKGTFIFDSPVDSNFQIFNIRSVDNRDGIDQVGASVRFWTTQSPGTLVRFDATPAANVNNLAIRDTTDQWQGLHFVYHAVDANNTFGIEFQWAVDSTSPQHWSSWSSIPEAYVRASDFHPVRSGLHTFYVHARNRWGVQSPDSTRIFNAYVPPFDSAGYMPRTLIVNNTNAATGNGTRGRPTPAQVEAFYRAVMDSTGTLGLGRRGNYSVFRVSPTGSQRWPPLDTLGNYSSVLVLMDQFIPTLGQGQGQVFSGTYQSAFKQYLSVGGKLIWSGTPAITVGGIGLPVNGSWMTDVFHVVPNAEIAYVSSSGLDFNGVTGALGYPSLALDTNKIAPDSVGAMNNIKNIGINYPRGFGRTISYFVSKSGGPLQGLPVGVRFLAPLVTPPRRQTYQVVYFGFPLYYGETPSIVESLKKAFQDINEFQAP